MSFWPAVLVLNLQIETPTENWLTGYEPATNKVTEPFSAVGLNAIGSTKHNSAATRKKTLAVTMKYR